MVSAVADLAGTVDARALAEWCARHGAAPPLGSVRNPWPAAGLRPRRFTWELADRIDAALASPVEHRVLDVLPGSPSEDELVAWCAHHPELGGQVVEAVRFWCEWFDVPRPGVEPAVDPVPDGRAEPVVDEVGRAAVDLASVTELTVEEARAVVEVHGLDLHPRRAVRLHRRMIDRGGRP